MPDMPSCTSYNTSSFVTVNQKIHRLNVSDCSVMGRKEYVVDPGL